jgi:hypothetical protein
MDAPSKSLTTCLHRIYEAWSNEAHLQIVLGEGVEAVKDSPHRCWGRHPLDAPASGFPPQRTPWATAVTSSPSQPSCLYLTWISGPLTLSWGGQTHWSHVVTGPGSTGIVKHLPVHGAWHIPDSVGHMGISIVMQHNDAPCEHARMLPLDGGTKVLGGRFPQLSICSNLPILLHHHGWLLECHAYRHVITCSHLYSLAVP